MQPFQHPLHGCPLWILPNSKTQGGSQSYRAGELGGGVHLWRWHSSGLGRKESTSSVSSWFSCAMSALGCAPGTYALSRLHGRSTQFQEVSTTP